MKHTALTAISSAFAITLGVLAATSAESSGQNAGLVRLQSVVPGVTQTGNVNVNGYGLFGGRVGIGTLSPASKLDVTRNWDGEQGAVNLLGDKPTLRFTGGSLAGNNSWAQQVGSNGPGNMGFFRRTGANAWNEVLELSTAGRVGIGVSPVTAALDFAQVTGPKLCFYPVNSSGNYGISVLPYTLALHSSDVGTDIVLGYGNSNGVTETMRLKGTGNVGIGTSAPGAKLDVNGAIATHALISTSALDNQSIQVRATNNVVKADLFYGTGGGSGGGCLNLYGGVGNRRFYHEGLADLSHGDTGMDDQNGNAKARMYISYVGLGIIQGDQKNFRMPDPDDAAKDIVYCCPEGPEAAMYDRGTAQLVNGRCHVDLPHHFSVLASPNGITLTLTPGSGASRGLAFENRSPEGFDVVELGGGSGSYAFDWEIKAVRRGHEDYRPERAWDDADMAHGADKKKAWENRQKDIQFYRERFAEAPMKKQ